jgi:ADP-heptose:LPS heptosyltransferase
MKKQVERVLFITLSNIGDVILTTTLLDRIIYDHPHAKVDVIVGKAAAPLMKELPCVEECYVVKKRKFHLHHLEVFNHFRHKKYDLIIDLRTPFLGKLLNGKKKISFQAQKTNVHMSRQFCNAWPHEQNRPYRPWVVTPPELQDKVRQKTAQIEHLVMICPTANWRGKQWPQKRFAELVYKLNQHKFCANTTFALVGAPWEEHLVKDLIDYLPAGKSINLLGKLDLVETAAWFKEADLFIGHDSGLAHLAGAVGLPTLTIFGPMYFDRYQAIGPYSEILVPPERSWREVNLARDAYPRLITDIQVETVLAKALEMLQNLAAKKEKIA